MPPRRLLMTALAALLVALPLPLSAGLFRADFKPVPPEELAMTSVPFAPGAPAVVLNWEHHQDDTEAYEEEYLKTKIFTDEGRKYGDVELLYVPDLTRITGIRARTVHADGSIVEFDGKMYDKLIVHSGRTRLMAKTFSVPDVRPGSVIEYRYRRSWPEHLLPTSRWTMQRDLPVLHAQLWMKPWEREFSSFFTYSGLPAGKVPVRVQDHYVLDLQNIPAFEKEPYAPPERELEARIDFYYTRADIRNASLYWQQTAKRFGDIVEGFISNRNGVKVIADELLAGAATPEERLRRLYARVQQLRNLSYEPSKTEQESRRESVRENGNAEDVLKNGYGSRDEITRTFVALARAAGFDAADVAVAPRAEFFFSPQLLDSTQLNGEIAMIMVDGKPLYLDPGTPFAPFGILSWENTNVSGLRLSRKVEAPVWLEVPEGGRSAAVTKRKAALHLDGDVLKGTVTMTYSGQEALVHRLAGHNEDEASNRKTIEEEAKNLLPPGASATLRSLSAMKAWNEPLVAVLDVQLPNVSSETGSRMLVPLSVFASSHKNPFASEQRRYPVYFAYSSEEDDEVTLALPDGYKVESVPQGGSKGGDALGFLTSFKTNENAVTFTRQLWRNTILVDAKDYAIVRRFFSAVNAADQDAVVLRKASAAGKAK